LRKTATDTWECTGFLDLNKVALGAAAAVSGTNGVAVGAAASAGASATAVGSSANASGTNALAIGVAAAAAGQGSCAVGPNANDQGVIRLARAVGVASRQNFKSILYANTTDGTTGVVMTADGLAAGTTNQAILTDNSAQSFRGRVVGTKSDHTAAMAFEFAGVARRGAGAATAALVAAVTPSTIAADAAINASVLTVLADATNGGVKLTIVGTTAQNINWVGIVESEHNAM
jgi:hypothetical protein